MFCKVWVLNVANLFPRFLADIMVCGRGSGFHALRHLCDPQHWIHHFYRLQTVQPFVLKLFEHHAFRCIHWLYKYTCSFAWLIPPVGKLLGISVLSPWCPVVHTNQETDPGVFDTRCCSAATVFYNLIQLYLPYTSIDPSCWSYKPNWFRL